MAKTLQYRVSKEPDDIKELALVPGLREECKIKLNVHGPQAKMNIKLEDKQGSSLSVWPNGHDVLISPNGKQAMTLIMDQGGIKALKIEEDTTFDERRIIFSVMHKEIHELLPLPPITIALAKLRPLLEKASSGETILLEELVRRARSSDLWAWDPFGPASDRVEFLWHTGTWHANQN